MCVTQSPSITKHSGSKLVDDIEIAFGNALGKGHLERGLEYDNEFKKHYGIKSSLLLLRFFITLVTHLAVFSAGFLLHWNFEVFDFGFESIWWYHPLTIAFSMVV